MTNPLTTSRRDFLKHSALLGAAVSIPVFSTIADDAKLSGAKNHWAILSDLHLPGDVHVERWSSNPNKHLEQAREEIFAWKEKPAGIIITGDLAHLYGNTEDYQTLGKQLEPFEQAEIPIYLQLGNHDHYENFTKALPRFAFKTSVKGKQTAVVETPNVNLFLLDSLEIPCSPELDVSAGLLGKKQLEWLAAELEKRPDKPAILTAHHTLEKDDLEDSVEFWEIVKSHKQVKAYIYGHTHRYGNEVRDNVHAINIPAMGFHWFGDNTPLGWSEAVFLPDGLELQLHTINKNHPKNNDLRRFQWLR